ncbi:hypothetical protein D3C78_1970490 [compost metagenome]
MLMSGLLRICSTRLPATSLMASKLRPVREKRLSDCVATFWKASRTVLVASARSSSLTKSGCSMSPVRSSEM